MKKDILWLRKIHRIDLISILVLLIGIAYRLYVLDFPYQTEDSHLDYIVANHVVHFGEIPFSGSGNPLLVDSPLYYYIVSFFVWIKDSLLFLGVVNIIIQAIAMLLIYKLAIILFDRRVGLVALLLGMVSYEYIEEARYFFQTHVMQPFALAAYVFLFLGYKTKKYRYVLMSAVSLSTALTIHHSILAILPLYIYLLLHVLWHDANRKKRIILLVSVVSGVLVFLHMPVIVLMVQNPLHLTSVTGNFGGGIVASLQEFVTNFVQNVRLFWLTFSVRGSYVRAINIVVAIGLIVSFIRYCTAGETDRRKKRYLILLFLAIFQIAVIASILKVGVWAFTFSSVFGLFLILVSVCITQWFSDGLVRKLLGVALLISVAYVFSSGLDFRYIRYSHLQYASLVKESAIAIRDTVLDLQTINHRDDLSFFQIVRVYKEPTGIYTKVYTKQGIQVIEDLLYWPILEQSFGRKFIRVEKHGSFPVILNTDEYLFVVCDSQRGIFEGQEDCMKRFMADSPDYVFERAVYLSRWMSIFLVHKLGT